MKVRGAVKAVMTTLSVITVTDFSNAVPFRYHWVIFGANIELGFTKRINSNWKRKKRKEREWNRLKKVMDLLQPTRASIKLCTARPQVLVLCSTKRFYHNS